MSDIKMKRILGISILFLVLVAFSGFASAATTGTGNHTKIIDKNTKIYDYWYITSTNKTQATIVFNSQVKIYSTSAHIWTISQTFRALLSIKTVSSTKFYGKTSVYINGKLVSSHGAYQYSQHSAIYNANIIEKPFINSFLNNE
jgi:hypothetical protein